MNSSESLIEAAGIDVAFGGRTVLAAAGVRVGAGEIVTLIGPNGAGKTTMIRVVLGLIRPDRGRVQRRRGLSIGYMPQRLVADPALPLTVDRFLALAAPGAAAAAGRRAALEEVGAAAVVGTPLQDISGGELQRVMLARALIRDPDLLVLDEPVQGVDVAGQAELYRLIGRIRTARGCGVLLVSHDLHLVMAETDHVICLNRHVCCEGHPEVVARDPAYAEMFGEQVATGFAVYHHRHDHRHGAGGEIVPLDRENETAESDHG